jgi:nucleoside 2-deoxyribosyltransferase
MKVFFIGDRKGSKKDEVYNDIISIIQKQGAKVDKTHFDRTSDEDSQHVEEAYILYMNSLKECDVVIAEVTDMSSGIGFMIATALNLKKPVLTLFDNKSSRNPSKTLTGARNKLLEFAEYSNSSLEQKINKFLISAKQKLDTKFILIIPAEIDRYLEWASTEKRMHKAQIVREAIEKVMDGDKEWKEYQKSL